MDIVNLDRRYGTAGEYLSASFIVSIFNALVGLSRSRGRSGSDGDKAIESRFETTLSDLSRLFYYFEAEAETLRLADELDLVERYLRLQSLRFEERLRYSIDVDSALLDTAIRRSSLLCSVDRAVAEACDESSALQLVRITGLAIGRCGGLLMVSRCSSEDGSVLSSVPGIFSHELA
jgi:Predicted signal transduction protein with a C-terminal ATPase domain